ncbi:MAG: hypothetical protein ACOC78_00290 [Actinomycetota bacterium]
MDRYTLSTEHSASSYGIPVLMDTKTGEVYGRGDTLPDGRRALEVFAEIENRPTIDGILNEKRMEILNAVEDMVDAVVSKAVKDQTSAIEAVAGRIHLDDGRFVEDAITDLISSVSQIAFGIGNKLSGVVLQANSACDSLLRDYAALAEDNDTG